MNAAKLEKRSVAPLGGVTIEFRRANCVSLHRSNPNLRLGPCQRPSLPDEREESIER
jgi:hypothetical protein